MAVDWKDIILVGAANHQEDDTSGPQGGAEDLSVKIEMSDVENVQVEAVSDNAGDTTQSVTVTGRITSGEISVDVIDLNGQTPAQAASPTSFERLEKAVKSASTTGTVAVMSVTNERNSELAQGGGVDYLTLNASASAVDNAYQFMVLRATGGTGTGQIAEIVRYIGADRRAYFRDVAVPFDATTTYEIAKGVVCDKITSPAVEIMEARRLFLNSASEEAGGSDVDRYEKIFIHNLDTAKALLSAVISELQVGIEEGANDFVAFALEASLDGSDTCTNRLTAPVAGYTFDSEDKSVPTGALSPDSGIGVWIRQHLPAGSLPLKGYIQYQAAGQST